MSEPAWGDSGSNESGGVAIVGGGPGGLAAAGRLAQDGVAVTVFDRMPSVGRKFLLAGRGGLNLTHSEDFAALVARYGAAADWLRPALQAYDATTLRAWAAVLGQPTFVGSSGRVFPAAFKATPLLRAWLARLRQDGVGFRLSHRWLGWDAQGGLRFATRDGERTLRPAATLLALGGASWPRLGSDGSWTGILRAHGVAVNPLRPANCGFLHAWSAPFRDRFAGQPLKRIAASAGSRTVRGEALLTAEGIEGGVVYALGASLREELERSGQAILRLDLRPDLDAVALAQKMGAPGLSRANAWRRAGLSPAAAGLLRECGGDPKCVEIVLTGTSGVDRAISTAGGIAREALDDRFMLHALPGVFAAGEMLDWEAPTGGYLLQASFSTGIAAAEGMLAWLATGAQAGGSPATGLLP